MTTNENILEEIKRHNENVNTLNENVKRLEEEMEIFTDKDCKLAMKIERLEEENDDNLDLFDEDGSEENAKRLKEGKKKLEEVMEKYDEYGNRYYRISNSLEEYDKRLKEEREKLEVKKATVVILEYWKKNAERLKYKNCISRKILNCGINVLAIYGVYRLFRG